MNDSLASAAAISQPEFLQKLKALLDSPVADLDLPSKQRLAADYLAGLITSTSVGSTINQILPSLKIIPFSPGRRPIDEALHHGYGCSEQVGILSTVPDGSPLNDEIWLLYQLKHVETLPRPLMS